MDPLRSTLHRLFEARVRVQPEADAFVCGETSLSYAELDIASNRFARRLRADGAGPEVVVALQVEHGLPAFIALLGIVKAGAAYVALAPSDPPARTRESLLDSGAHVLVTDQSADTPAFDGITIRLPQDLTAIDRELAASLEPSAEAGHLFQIVYTSGSTGRPKGALVPMTAILNRLAAMSSAYPFRPDDVALLHRPFSIIGSSWDCFGPLLSGVPTIVVRNFNPIAPTVWRQICKRRVSHVAAAPSMWELILDQAERRPGEWTTLRLAIIGGQSIDVAFVRRWKAAFPDATLLNIYGASECVYPTAHEARSDGDPTARVPAGTAFPGVRVHVVDDELNERPCGAVGDVCVAGACLARGYLNRPGLTADRFVPNPLGGPPGSLLFRTGDVGLRTPDGLLHITGRRDRQVKVHGYRVDLGEVESALLQCPRIVAAAVTAEPIGGGDTRLAAYVVAADNAPLSAQDLRYALSAIVPRYMRPHSVVRLPELPLTRSGKVDYQRLPAPA